MPHKIRQLYRQKIVFVINSVAAKILTFLVEIVCEFIEQSTILLQRTITV